MALIGVRTGFWYPRITYTPVGGVETVVDFDDPIRLIETGDVWIGGQNRAESGVTESLEIRQEQSATVHFDPIEADRMSDLRAFFRSMFGRQFAITLDRLATTTTQYEYEFNTTFTKAELVTPEFRPQRSQLTRGLYRLPVAFRQGV